MITSTYNKQQQVIERGEADYFKSYFPKDEIKSNPVQREPTPKNPTIKNLPENVKPALQHEPSAITEDQISTENRSYNAVSNRDQYFNYRDALSSEVDTEYLDTIAPPLQKSFNLAAFVNKSETLQQFVKMGVDLNRIEKRGYGQYFAQLDFTTDVKDILIFLNDLKVDPNVLGHIITKNPDIFKNSIQEMETRVEYLRRKKFKPEDIPRIISIQPNWINLPVDNIDKKLGLFQKEFKLTGDEVRFVAVRDPKLILRYFNHTRELSFVLKEELGFTEPEAKDLLLKKPKLWRLAKKSLTERLDYIHNTMGFSHQDILDLPDCLLRRKFLIEQRHLYLVKLGRAQYDKTKPGYVSLQALIIGEEAKFCSEITSTSIEDYNEFLKTL